MNFDFSEDQKMLKDQVNKFLTDKAPYSVTRKVLNGQEPYSKDVWNGLVEMGLTGITIPEEFGGLGLSALELAVVAEELGRAAAAVPYSSSVYLATEAIRLFGTQSQKETWLPKLAAGEIIGTFALAEGTHAASAANLKTTFAAGKINGEKLPVADGSYADVAVLVVNSGGSAISLAIVDLTGAGVTRTKLKTVDDARDFASITFKDAPAELMSEPGNGWAQMQRIYDGAAVLMAFEQVGGTEAAMELARAYTMERYAFGRIVASYQAVKHKVADMYVKKEVAKSNAYYGAMLLKDEDADLPEAAAAARVSATEAYTFAAEEGLHLHGGIGFTWEADTQFHYRRAKVLGLALGPIALWRDRLVNHLVKKNAA